LISNVLHKTTVSKVVVVALKIKQIQKNCNTNK